MAEMAVLQALQRAGRRLLARRSRAVRGPLQGAPPWELHVHLPVGDTDLDVLLRDAWAIPEALGLPSSVIESLDHHVRILLAAGLGYCRDDLIKTVVRLPLEQLALPWDALTDTEEAHASNARSH
ncbi:hypothetical protein [Streptomyces violaceus]|uniref:Uncharacterized protein n=1 Tax=Streptomyces violaceus TaxID=1936 RepID=A0ABZ1NLF7_STRVL